MSSDLGLPTVPTADNGSDSSADDRSQMTQHVPAAVGQPLPHAGIGAKAPNQGQRPQMATIATRLCRLAPASVLAAAVAIGATTLSAPAAHAIPESTIESECKAAGGTYTSGILSSGDRESTCCYTDIDGDKWCDWYLNGEYLGTDPAAQGEPGDAGIPPKLDPSTLVPPVVGPDVGTPPPPKPVVPTVPVQPLAVG
jgi:hypothetical protein